MLVYVLLRTSRCVLGLRRKKLLKSGYLSEKYFQPVGEVLDLVDGEVDVVEHGEAHRAPIAQGQVHLVTAGTSSNNNRYI